MAGPIREPARPRRLRLLPHASAALAHNRRRTADAAQPTDTVIEGMQRNHVSSPSTGARRGALSLAPPTL